MYYGVCPRHQYFLKFPGDSNMQLILRVPGLHKRKLLRNEICLVLVPVVMFISCVTLDLFCSLDLSKTFFSGYKKSTIILSIHGCYER